MRDDPHSYDFEELIIRALKNVDEDKITIMLLLKEGKAGWKSFK